MKRLGTILRGAVTVCLCLILVANLWLIFARVALRQDLPMLFGFGQTVVISGSMEPALSPGDLLILRAGDGYGEGDVITYRLDGAFVTHRVVGRSPEGLVTRGDANNTDDQKPVTPVQIVGRVVLAIPRVGQLIAFLQSPLGVLVLAAAGLAMIALVARQDI